MIGVKFNLDQFKRGFFDSRAVVNALDKITYKAFGYFGGWVRRTARRNIRNRKRVSRPYEGPTNRTGLLRDFIFYAFDRNRRSVVIGPAKLNQVSFDMTFQPHTGTGAELLEYGGNAQILESRWPGQTNWSRADLRSRRRLAAKETRFRGIAVAPRPFMNPAFELGHKKLPEFYRSAGTPK